MGVFTVEQPRSVLGPLIITSTLPRSGTTLLQRLITNSSNGICFGENLAGRFFALADLVHEAVYSVDTELSNISKEWEQIRAGKTDFWMPRLDLPDDHSKNALLLTLNTYSQYHATVAAELGRPVWGMKLPGQKIDAVARISKYVPNSKCILIYRNIYDVIKSYKGREALNGEVDLKEICQKWVSNSEIVVRALKQDDFQVQNLLILKYEEFVDDYEKGVASLKEFTGLEDIDMSVTERKLNSWYKTKHMVHVYQEPVELTHAEKSVIENVCSKTMAVLYPEAETPAS
ncbi:sulfotransferase [Roseibium sp.]|uniref:sulfotransferase n=1 Tax=Roseibium sp. TaxID=1936156 RepID=UPI003A974E17